MHTHMNTIIDIVMNLALMCQGLNVLIWLNSEHIHEIPHPNLRQRTVLGVLINIFRSGCNTEPWILVHVRENRVRIQRFIACCCYNLYVQTVPGTNTAITKEKVYKS